MSTAPASPPARDRRAADDFVSEVHVYLPHVVGLPPLRPYLRELWRRRHFTYEMSRTTLRSQHFATVFGQLWLLINPLLLGVVYFLLVDILGRGRHGPNYFIHLLGALFAYQLVNMAVSEGAKSVTGGGRLILNTAFPRLLLPISSSLTALQRFAPTLAVYAVAHAVSGIGVGRNTLWALPAFALLALFAMGMAIIFSVLQVYFRDVRSFLPYFLRIWLYLSPVLYAAHDVPDRLRPFIQINPLYPLLGAWNDALQGRAPSAGFFLQGALWATGVVVIGSLFFLSREREFAVRL